MRDGLTHLGGTPFYIDLLTEFEWDCSTFATWNQVYGQVQIFEMSLVKY